MKDIYDQITRRIVEQLEKGVVPWKSPYFSKVGFPKNFSTQKEYRGINVMLLGSLRFTSPFFLTFLQAKELGGNVRKGERGHLVVKYGTIEGNNDAENTEGISVKKRGYLRGYTVFHESQIEGIDFPQPENLEELPLTQRTDQARAIIEGMPQRPSLREGSAVPCYRPSTDCVHMPAKEYFENEEAYYHVLFHELAHSTGHVSRLARKSFLNNVSISSAGDTSQQQYAEEELVAEMSASFLGAHAGFSESEVETSATYLKSWADTLRRKEAAHWLPRAASEGQKATDFILGRS